MTGMTSHKQHHWSFFSQMGNEDVSQEAEKDLLGNSSIGIFLEEGIFKPFQRIEARIPGIGEDQQWWKILPYSRGTGQHCHLLPCAVCDGVNMLGSCPAADFFGLWTDAEAAFISIKNSVRKREQSRVHGVQVLFHLLKPFSQGFFCHHCSLQVKCLPHPFRYLWVSFEKHLHPVFAKLIVPEDRLHLPPPPPPPPPLLPLASRVVLTISLTLSLVRPKP